MVIRNNLKYCLFSNKYFNSVETYILDLQHTMHGVKTDVKMVKTKLHINLFDIPLSKIL